MHINPEQYGRRSVIVTLNCPRLLFEPFSQRPIFIIAFVGCTAFQIGDALAPNATALLIFRFLSGVFAARSVSCSNAIHPSFTLCMRMKFLILCLSQSVDQLRSVYCGYVRSTITFRRHAINVDRRSDGMLIHVERL